jgi:hypothetical protein
MKNSESPHEKSPPEEANEIVKDENENETDAPQKDINPETDTEEGTHNMTSFYITDQSLLEKTDEEILDENEKNLFQDENSDEIVDIRMPLSTNEITKSARIDEDSIEIPPVNRTTTSENETRSIMVLNHLTKNIDQKTSLI